VKILVVAAHPDDEVLGCGGTVARLISEGNEASVLILGEGITSRDAERNDGRRIRELKKLRRHIFRAQDVIGTKKVYTHDFPDNRFDEVPLLEIVKVVEKIKESVSPDMIFTHYAKDLNIDHQLTYQAVLTATRPLPGETVKEIYSFEILSSTEWNYPLSFSPNIFFNIEDTLKHKLNGMKEYTSELRDYPHPRSLKGIEKNASYWGMRIGKRYAEAFETVRAIK
jgi:LmbE family N-acetylglucosaminyl deacetylase